jgi:hypothetical protein
VVDVLLPKPFFVTDDEIFQTLVVDILLPEPFLDPPNLIYIFDLAPWTFTCLAN